MTQPANQRLLTESRRGVANGVAALDSAGKVIDSTGKPVAGSVQSVNGALPDASGNISLTTGNSPTLATLPAGIVLATSTSTRPTSRPDVIVIFTGGTDPGAAALDGDLWLTQ